MIIMNQDMKGDILFYQDYKAIGLDFHLTIIINSLLIYNFHIFFMIKVAVMILISLLVQDTALVINFL